MKWIAIWHSLMRNGWPFDIHFWRFTLWTINLAGFSLHWTNFNILPPVTRFRILQVCDLKAVTLLLLPQAFWWSQTRWTFGFPSGSWSTFDQRNLDSFHDIRGRVLRVEGLVDPEWSMPYLKITVIKNWWLCGRNLLLGLIDWRTFGAVFRFAFFHSQRLKRTDD